MMIVDAGDVATAFGLGDVLAPVERAGGGNINEMFRLATARGEFAVKVMNPEPADGGFVARTERAFRFETAAHAAGIACPRPVATGEGRCLARVTRDGGDALVRVHTWVDGTALQQAVHPPATAADVGGIIARIHGLAIEPEDGAAEAAGGGREELLRDFGVAHWEALTERVERSRFEWAWQYRAMLPDVAEIEAIVSAARAEGAPAVMGHRDADAKNFMLSPGGTLLLVDWDQAGPAAPQQEVASLALRWGGVVLGEPSREVVRAFIEGYRAAGGRVDQFRPPDCAGFLNAMLGWYELNARRALGETPCGPGGEAAATLAVLRGFANVRRFAASVERWVGVLNG
jgi:Ser/Thr protein kinase RdoA (MazF antagonist)